MDGRHGALYIEVSNSYDGELNEINGKLISTKESKEGHGLGIRNVKRMVQDQQGEMVIKSDNNTFDVKILLYL